MKTLYKNVLATTLTTLAMIGLSACGGGGGGDNADFSNAEQKIPIDVNCTTPTTINTYIPLYSGDVLVQAEANTTIETYHNIDGTKKVCLVSGNAYIIRK